MLLFSINIHSQGYDKSCYFGITFDVSNNQNWGFGELIITAVEPHSPAEKAGIKVDDIIMEINDKATFLRDNQTIADWLFGDMYAPEVNFTIRNMNTYFKEYTLYRKCIAINAVSEAALANIFSFYSLEDTNQRKLKLPIHVQPRPETDYTDYHTYDFYKDEDGTTDVDAHIIELLEKDLNAKGLVRDTDDPDIVVQAYYSYEPNPKYKENSTITPSWRYDAENEQMVRVPIIDPENSNLEATGQFIAEYGFSFYDRKYINDKELTQIWDCSIKDCMSADLPLREYVRLHTPMMLKQFPFTTSKVEAEYRIEFSRYNYTGLYFNADDLITISDVDVESPAYTSGIRPGYIVKKINGRSFNHTKETLSEGYKSFISETMVYRDQNTKFTNADGYADCMYWAPNSYSSIVKELNKSKYVAHFSYLYDFRKYVNGKDDNTITIEAWDGMQNRIFTVTPEIRKSVTVKTF